ncbi:MAG: family 43 glycosylhydrolase [Gemmatimonadaceae bacterium]
MRTAARTIAAIALTLGAACGTGTRAAPVPAAVAPCTFANPLGRGQDPWIVRQGGSYYFIESDAVGITVYRSPTLTNPKQNGIVVWRPPKQGWNRTNVWAPELHFIDGRWYVYYAAGSSGPPYVHQHAGVLESPGADPQQGPYADRGILYTGDSIATGRANRWAIDLTVHALGGKLYAVWSGWVDSATTDRTPQHLFIARMSNPWSIATNRVKISSPTESWEQPSAADGLALEEGPEFLEHDGKVFIVYSTGESWLPAYKLGALRLKAPLSDAMNPDSVVKTGPVFAGTPTVYGVGHASFTLSPDSTESWIMYHAKVAPAPGWRRDIRAQKFGWKADGSPDFGRPVDAGVSIPRPSGECVGGGGQSR